MNILIACEYSGALRDRFYNAGHNVYSVDLLPGEGVHTHRHMQEDIGNVLNSAYAYGLPNGRHVYPNYWDMLIAFPDCTYLTISAEWAYKAGPYHQKVKPGTLTGEARHKARIEAIEFVDWLYNQPIYCIAIENPIGVLSTQWRKPDQIIQPYQFGDDASKATCLWLKNLKPLKHTKQIDPRIVNGKPRWGNQTDSGQNKLPPTKDRAKIRSKTYPGIADAMADQWSHNLRGNHANK